MFVVACTQKVERNEIVDSEFFSQEAFKNIKFQYVNKMNKEKSVMSNVYIDKQELSVDLFENEIEKKILEKGWRKLAPDFEDQRLYCHGKKNRMSIVYPRKEIYKNKDGDILNIKKKI